MFACVCAWGDAVCSCSYLLRWIDCGCAIASESGCFVGVYAGVDNRCVQYHGGSLNNDVQLYICKRPIYCKEIGDHPIKNDPMQQLTLK